MIRTAQKAGAAPSQREWAASRPAPARELTPAAPHTVAAAMLGVMTLMLVGGALAQLL